MLHESKKRTNGDKHGWMDEAAEQKNKNDIY
jgi:hypothetical protein